ncbi:fatty acid desaturase family protein [Exilibacterium tricleocarpae]|nr:fatty acid desaturase family protein [Exilibacterium tricleocarpae]
MDFRKLLTREELEPFLQKSDAWGLWLLVCNWGLIAAAFALVAFWPNLLTCLVAVIVLANRQLGISVLMHDCSHQALFRSRGLNQWVGKWLCAAPVFADLDGYRRYHMRHHRDAGTTADPDYPNYKNYPVTKMSVVRKTLRDLVGYTGLKTFYAVLLMHAGLLEYDMSYQHHRARKRPGPLAIMGNLARNLWAPVLVNVGLWVLLYSTGHGYLFGLWVLAYLTLFMFFARMRNAAEHANVPDLLDRDPRLHARTTHVNWLERLTFAPNHVNYHMEHHWAPGVPPYRLAALHRFLTAKGVLADTPVANSYADVYRAMVGAPEAIIRTP